MSLSRVGDAGGAEMLVNVAVALLSEESFADAVNVAARPVGSFERVIFVAAVRRQQQAGCRRRPFPRIALVVVDDDVDPEPGVQLVPLSVTALPGVTGGRWSGCGPSARPARRSASAVSTATPPRCRSRPSIRARGCIPGRPPPLRGDDYVRTVEVARYHDGSGNRMLDVSGGGATGAPTPRPISTRRRARSCATSTSSKTKPNRGVRTQQEI